MTAYGLEGGAAAIARKIGFETGRVIYILDALDDLAEDVKKERYNPFALVYGNELSPEEKQSVKNALLIYLSEMETAFDLMDSAADPVRKEILNNILYLGMPGAMDRVLGCEACKEEEYHE